MAKKEVKQTKTEIIDKIIEYTEYAIAPVTALLVFWNANAGLYVSAFAGMVVSILTFVKLFIKE